MGRAGSVRLAVALCCLFAGASAFDSLRGIFGGETPILFNEEYTKCEVCSSVVRGMSVKRVCSELVGTGIDFLGSRRRKCGHIKQVFKENIKIVVALWESGLSHEEIVGKLMPMVVKLGHSDDEDTRAMALKVVRWLPVFTGKCNMSGGITPELMGQCWAMEHSLRHAGDAVLEKINVLRLNSAVESFAICNERDVKEAAGLSLEYKCSGSRDGGIKANAGIREKALQTKSFKGLKSDVLEASNRLQRAIKSHADVRKTMVRELEETRRLLMEVKSHITRQLFSSEDPPLLLEPVTAFLSGTVDVLSRTMVQSGLAVANTIGQFEEVSKDVIKNSVRTSEGLAAQKVPANYDFMAGLDSDCPLRWDVDSETFALSMTNLDFSWANKQVTRARDEYENLIYMGARRQLEDLIAKFDDEVIMKVGTEFSYHPPPLEVDENDNDENDNDANDNDGPKTSSALLYVRTELPEKMDRIAESLHAAVVSVDLDIKAQDDPNDWRGFNDKCIRDFRAVLRDAEVTLAKVVKVFDSHKALEEGCLQAQSRLSNLRDVFVVPAWEEDSHTKDSLPGAASKALDGIVDAALDIASDGALSCSYHTEIASALRYVVSKIVTFVKMVESVLDHFVATSGLKMLFFWDTNPLSKWYGHQEGRTLLDKAEVLLRQPFPIEVRARLYIGRLLGMGNPEPISEKLHRKLLSKVRLYHRDLAASAYDRVLDHHMRNIQSYERDQVRQATLLYTAMQQMLGHNWVEDNGGYNTMLSLSSSPENSPIKGKVPVVHSTPSSNDGDPDNLDGSSNDGSDVNLDWSESSVNLDWSSSGDGASTGSAGVGT